MSSFVLFFSRPLSLFVCLLLAPIKRRSLQFSPHSIEVLHSNSKTAVGTIKWVDIKYKLMQPNFNVTTFLFLELSSLLLLLLFFFCWFEICVYHVRTTMYSISDLILMHPLWAAPISTAHTYTIILTLQYFEFRKEFPLVLFLSFALSGFLCNKPLQLTAYFCTSTMNLLFTNVWATIQCIGMAQLRYAKGHTHTKNELNWSVLKK